MTSLSNVECQFLKCIVMLAIVALWLQATSCFPLRVQGPEREYLIGYADCGGSQSPGHLCVGGRGYTLDAGMVECVLLGSWSFPSTCPCSGQPIGTTRVNQGPARPAATVANPHQQQQTQKRRPPLHDFSIVHFEAQHGHDPDFHRP